MSHDPADHCLFHAWLLRLNFLETLGPMARASTIPGLGVFAPIADDAPARLEFQQMIVPLAVEAWQKAEVAA